MTTIKTVTIHKDTVVKTDTPACIRVEAEKTMRAFEIGKASGLFRSPRVLDYDASEGILVLERLRSITPLHLALTSGREGRLLVETVAASLAVIHDELDLPEDMHVPLPEELSFAGSSVALHGDLSTRNVFAMTGNTGIAILDWHMTQQCGGDATYGTRYFDVMWFVSNLFAAFCKWGHAYRHAKDAMPIATKFINRYLQSANTMGDVKDVVLYARQFVMSRLEQKRSWKRMVLGLPGRRKMQRWIDNPQLEQEILKGGQD